MDSVLAVARAGLLADFERLAVHAQNLSNLDTTGYRRQVPVTSEFDAALGQVSWLPDVVAQSGSLTDISPGALKETGRPLDLALEGDGYFCVRTAQGVRYTRRGDFSVDAVGRLVDSAGNPVMGAGGDIVLPSASVSVDRQGRIFNGTEEVGRIDIAYFSDASRLSYVGAGAFDAGTQTPTSPLTPVNVRSGYLEASNVQPAHEMIGLLETSRRVAMTRNVLNARDEMLDSAINTLAQF